MHHRTTALYLLKTTTTHYQQTPAQKHHSNLGSRANNTAMTRQKLNVHCKPTRKCLGLDTCTSHQMNYMTVNFIRQLIFSRPRSEGWPHYGRTFSIYPCPLSYWLTLPRRVLSTSWCCPSRPCVAFLSYACGDIYIAITVLKLTRKDGFKCLKVRQKPFGRRAPQTIWGSLEGIPARHALLTCWCYCKWHVKLPWRTSCHSLSMV